MITIDARDALGDFDITQTGQVNFLVLFSENLNQYVWDSSAGWRITTNGNMRFDPLNGVDVATSTVSEILIDFDRNGIADVTITLTGEFISLSALLLSEENFWTKVLAGETTILPTETQTSTIAGDLLEVAAGDNFTAYDDLIDASSSSVNQILVGDVIELRGHLTAGNDEITGGSGVDKIYGDRLNSYSGATIIGGHDILNGGGGADEIFGQSGNDIINGGAGADILKGGKGNDTFVVSSGSDTILGGGGINTLDFSDLFDTSSVATINMSFVGELVPVLDQLHISWTGSATEYAGTTISDYTNISHFYVDEASNLTILGDVKDETFELGAGVNTALISGLRGDDTIDGSLAGDVWADYSKDVFFTIDHVGTFRTLGVIVDLEAGTATDFFGDTDTLIGVENAIGTGAFYDGVIGTDADNRIVNAEVVYAFGGDDNIFVTPEANALGIGGPTELANLNGLGNAGTAYIDGGSGNDWLHFTGYIGAIFVDLTTGTSIGPGLVYDFDNIENVSSNGTATIFGDEEDNIFEGSNEDDTLEGRGGNDLLKGNGGADDMDGGTGKDTASYVGSSVGVSVSLADGTGFGGHAEGDTFTSIENLTGSNGADLLTGDDNANVLEGGLGGDRLDGGLGIDTASYENSYVNVQVDLGVGTTIGGHAAGDILISIENLSGSDYDDILTGSDSDNTLTGGSGGDELYGKAGNDIIKGGQGEDQLFGGEGNDILMGRAQDDLLEGGEGADTLDGGAGVDWLSYENSILGVTIKLAGNTASGGDAKGDEYSNFENVAGSDAADVIYGDSGANWLVANAGNDNIKGFEGEDLIFGISGENTLRGGDDGDYITGGIDGDTIFGDDGDDFLLGGDGQDYMIGGIGNDTLYGGEGNDTLQGRSGEDTLYGDGGDDILRGESQTDMLYGGDNNDFIDAAGGADIAEGGSGEDTILGGDGSDVITGGADNDITDGGIGNNTFVFNTDDGADRIRDWSLGDNQIDFSGNVHFNSFADVQAVMVDQTNGHLRIDFDATNEILLLNTLSTDLDASDFVF